MCCLVRWSAPNALTLLGSIDLRLFLAANTKLWGLSIIKSFSDSLFPSFLHLEIQSRLIICTFFESAFLMVAGDPFLNIKCVQESIQVDKKHSFFYFLSPFFFCIPEKVRRVFAPIDCKALSKFWDTSSPSSVLQIIKSLHHSLGQFLLPDI